MADPIQPNASYPPPLSSSADDPPPAPVCVPECTTKPPSIACDEQASSDHVIEMMKAYPAATAAPKTSTIVATATRVGNNDAERLSQTPYSVGYAASGVTENGSKYATAALVYGFDAKGNTMEGPAVSVQAGPQNEIQAVAARQSTTVGGIRLTSELLTAQASVGTHNKDGSVGANVSASASLWSVDATKNFNGSSISVGFSPGPAIDASSGVRDSDGDGALEWCLRAGSTVTVGVCIEAPSGWRRGAP